MTGRLAGQVAIVTGASRGLGEYCPGGGQGGSGCRASTFRAVRVPGVNIPGPVPGVNILRIQRIGESPSEVQRPVIARDLSGASLR